MEQAEDLVLSTGFSLLPCFLYVLDLLHWTVAGAVSAVFSGLQLRQ